MLKGNTLLNYWAKLAQSLLIRNAIYIVNYQILICNKDTNKVGKSRTKSLVPANIKKALQEVKTQYGELNFNLIAKHRLKIGNTKLLVLNNGEKVGLLKYNNKKALKNGKSLTLLRLS